MSNYIEVVAIVEGRTEQIFIEKILAPYLGYKNIGLSATQVSKPGQKGGDVSFSRVKKDLKLHLRQRSDTYITTFVDYYGTKEWPGLDIIPQQASAEQIADTVNNATKEKVTELFGEHGADVRFIPYMAIHEFEALLFSDSKILADELQMADGIIEKLLQQCGSPEEINNSPDTAPSKRIKNWSSKFGKTTTGIKIAEKIGIDKMREMCPTFNSWLKELENIQENL